MSVALQQDIELTRARAMPKRVAQRILPLLANDWLSSEFDEEYPYHYLGQLLHEAMDLGLLQITTVEDRERVVPGPKLDVWTGQDVRMQTSRLVRRWPTNRFWMDHVGTKFNSWMGFTLNVPVAREVALNLLRQCQPGVWYDTRALARKVLDADPFALRPSQRISGRSGFKLVDEIRQHWDVSDAELLIGQMKSTLYEYGLVTLGYDAEMPPVTRAERNPDAIMLTDLGAEVINSEGLPGAELSARPLITQPNFEILLLEPHMAALYHVMRFAEPQKIGRASGFKLTREALLRAMAGGISFRAVQDFLEAHSQKAMPQNVLYTMNDWARQYKETRLSKVILIEVDDEALATELSASAKLRQLGLRRVGPTALATPDGAAVGIVRRAIEKAGYTARTSETAPPVKTPAVR